MKMTAITFACAGALLALTPAYAQEAQNQEARLEPTAGGDEAGDDAAERDDEAVVCRTMAPKVGTRISERQVCLPLYQWAEWEKTTRETAREIEMRGRLFKQ